MAKSKTKKDFLEDYLYSEEFEYDIESDPVFKALKDSVKESARKSAEDILGKYSQISGGGSVSSSAISAATQGANNELERLAEEIPELYELAKEMYNDRLAEKERKFRAAMDYDSHVTRYPQSEEFEDNSKNEEDTPIGEPAVDKEEALPDEPKEKDYSKGGNGLTTGSLAAKDTAKHQMDKNVFTMTKKLIETYISIGNTTEANTLYSRFKASMSEAQRLEIEKLLKGK